MSWEFSGAADTYAVCNPGAVPQDGAPISVWWMIRPSAIDFFGVYTGLTGATNVVGLLVFSGETFTVNDGTGGPTLLDDEWQIIGYDDNNAAGGTVRWHHCTDLDGTPTWAHSDGATSGDRNGTVDTLRLGIGPDGNPFRMKGHIAAGAIASGRLGDAGFEALGVTDMADWVAAADVAWQFNVAPGATSLTDLTGGTANQTSLTGTPTLDTVQEPPNWVYYVADPAIGNGFPYVSSTISPRYAAGGSAAYVSSTIGGRL